jgi:tRNA threonylcarbamoyladenosine biosynthesis protein TsaE
MEKVIKDLAALPEVAKELLSELKGHNVLAFEGEMGAGKTTLILEMLKALGIKDPEGSPTYSLVNTYVTPNGKDVYHFDFYRINSIEEALDMGIEDLIYGDALCLIEWPKKVEELLPEETIWLYLSVQEQTHFRILSYHL